MKLLDIYRQLTEVRVIDIRNWRGEEPIYDDDVIRVYHGFGGNAWAYPSVVAKYGLSGKSRAKRVYSYESSNNPRGLFVSADFDKVKQYFAGSGVIMEFHAKVSDLEAPVWNSEGGGYFVQGQKTKGFDSPEDRESRRLKNREEFKNSDNPAVANSDRPELAFWLLNPGESQALYTGDLNPNMIRAFWVNETLMNDRKHGGPWKRMSRNEFAKKYPPKPYKDISGREQYHDVYYDAEGKAFKPNDDFDIKKIQAVYDIPEEEIINVLKRNDFSRNSMMWPKQIKQFKEKYM